MKLIFSLDPMRVSMTGIGRYTYELAKGLRDSNALEEIKYQFLLGWADSPEALVKKYHTKNDITSAMPPRKFKRFAYNAVRSVFRSVSPTIQGVLARQLKDHVYHSPSFVLPRFSGKCVSTVHDMSAFRVPQYHPASRVKYQRDIFPHLINKGNLFITDSEFSRTELLDFFPVPEERVVSVPLGADLVFQPRSILAVSAVLSDYGLTAGCYTLSVGTIEPRKNIERLIDAYACLSAELRYEFPLVLAGGRGWNSEHIHQKIARYTSEGWLIYLSFVRDADLPLIYSGARLFAFLSHYEGFGLPVLEAMSSGIPVISSNAASLPEVGGDAVIYVDPNDEEAIISALETVLTDDAQLLCLSERGIARAKIFSWSRAVNETLDAYRRIA